MQVEACLLSDLPVVSTESTELSLSMTSVRTTNMYSSSSGTVSSRMVRVKDCVVTPSGNTREPLVER